VPFIMLNSDTALTKRGFSYWVGTVTPANGWKEVDFDDSQW